MTFDELHKDMIFFIILKNKGLELKASSLSKEVETLKDKDEKSKVNEEILIREILAPNLCPPMLPDPLVLQSI